MRQLSIQSESRLRVAESGLCEQLLCNFHAEHSCNCNSNSKLNKKWNYVKKRISVTFFEMGAGIEKKEFGLVYGHKIQTRNPIKYFIMTKQIVGNRTVQILASLYL